MFDLNPYLIERKERLDFYDGKPQTPNRVAHRMVDMSRGTGRTRILIEALPEDGRCVVLVWNTSTRDYLKSEIRDVRGYDFPIQEVKFLTWADWKKNLGERLRGYGPMPVFV